MPPHSRSKWMNQILSGLRFYQQEELESWNGEEKKNKPVWEASAETEKTFHLITAKVRVWTLKTALDGNLALLLSSYAHTDVLLTSLNLLPNL